MAIIAIVEGHGEVESLPILVRRVSSELHGTTKSLPQSNMMRLPRSKLLRDDGIENAVKAASIKLGNLGDILILLDSDDDAPEELEAHINFRAKSVAPHMNVNGIVAVREYEAWIIHSVESLRGKRGLPNDISPPDNPDIIRGAKEWLSSRMEGHTYSETADCAAFTAQMDLIMAMNSASFKKLCDAIASCG